MTNSAVATKQDLDDIYIRTEKMIGNVVGEIVGDALQLIAERFDRVDEQFAEMGRHFKQVDSQGDQQNRDMKDLRTRMIRLETKYDTTRDLVDHNTIDIRALQRQAA